MFIYKVVYSFHTRGFPVYEILRWMYSTGLNGLSVVFHVFSNPHPHYPSQDLHTGVFGI